jgi:hypothetical protein
MYNLVEARHVKAGIWSIDRTAPGQERTRSRFEGAREEAEAEVVRLNRLTEARWNELAGA